MIPRVEVTRNSTLDEMESNLVPADDEDEEDEVDEIIYINSSPEVIEVSSDSDTIQYQYEE